MGKRPIYPFILFINLPIPRKNTYRDSKIYNGISIEKLKFKEQIVNVKNIFKEIITFLTVMSKHWKCTFNFVKLFKYIYSLMYLTNNCNSK